MLPPCRLNERSQSIITNLHRNFKGHPQFMHLTVTLNSELTTTGCMSIEVSNNGRPVNLFMFCPNWIGDIGSAAIFGSNLNGHYSTISKSHNFFGLPVTDISMDNSGLSNFVDIQIGKY